MRLVIAITIMWLVAGPAGAQHPAIDHEVERLVPQITEIRHQIHAHPELGNREVATAALIADYLRAVGFDDIRTGVAHTGVVAVLRGHCQVNESGTYEGRLIRDQAAVTAVHTVNARARNIDDEPISAGADPRETDFE